MPERSRPDAELVKPERYECGRVLAHFAKSAALLSGNIYTAMIQGQTFDAADYTRPSEGFQ